MKALLLDERLRDAWGELRRLARRSEGGHLGMEVRAKSTWAREDLGSR
jgi:hypothetical protein